MGSCLSTTATSQRPLSSFPKVAVVEVQLSVYKTHQPRDVECGGVGCLGGKIDQKNEHERNNLVVEEKEGEWGK